jgi:predicted dehydrogenase
MPSDSPSNKIGLALIGCGFMGRRHLLGLSALQKVGMLDAELVAVMDVDSVTVEALAVLAEELLGKRPVVYTSLEALLADSAVQAVDIVTGPRTHHSIAVRALESHRHVLCEKPLALTIKGARLMLEAATRSGAILATAENYRRGGANRMAKAVIESGLLGKLHLMTEFWAGGDDRIIISKWRHMKNSGAIGLDMSIHFADIIEYFVGPIERVWGRGIIAEPLRYPKEGGDPIEATGEDALFASMRSASGVDVQYTYLPSGPGINYQQRSLHGVKGSMTVPPDRTDGDVVVHLAGEELKGAALRLRVGEHLNLSPVTKAVLGEDGSGGKGRAWADVDAGYLAIEIHDFIEAIREGRAPEVDGMGGLRALAVVYAILESGVAGREMSVEDVLKGRVHAYQDEIDESLEWATS